MPDNDIPEWPVPQPGQEVAVGVDPFDMNNVYKQTPSILWPMMPAPAPEVAPSQGAWRYNSGKIKLSYTPLALAEGVSAVMEFGATKYERDNWKKGFKYLDLVDSLQRHLMAWSEGEDVDKESGLNHIWHVACNVAFICHQIKHGTGTDDRPKAS